MPSVPPIIVAFDEHEHAGDALGWGASLAALTGAPLVVVSVFEPTYSEVAPGWMDELLERRRSLVREMLAEIGVVDAEVDIRTGNDPIAVITSIVREHDADMLVIGSRSIGGPGGLGAPSPVHHFLQHIHTAVAVIRPDAPALASGRVIVGVDGSPANDRAIEFASRHARAAHASLRAVHVRDHADDDARSVGLRRDIRRDLDAITGDVPLLELVGHPVDMLIEAAREQNAAALVVGTRGRGGFDGLRVGRVPLQLVAHAPCPVIVVPH